MPVISRPIITLSGVAALCDHALFTWFFRPIGGGFDAVGYLIGRDYLQMWAAPRFAAARGAAALSDFPAFSAAIPGLVGIPGLTSVWSYPPTALLLFTAFSFPSYWVSLAFWTAAGWAACVASAFALRGTRPAAPLLLLLAASPAAWLNTETGQNGAFTAALLVGGFALLGRRPALAGVLFGVLTFKPQLGIALAVGLLALEAWRTIVVACATALTLALVATLLFGLEPWLGYESVSIPYNARILAASYGGQKLLLVSLTSALTQAGLTLHVALAAQAVAALVVCAALWPAMRRTADPVRRLALVACATPLVTPYVWTYDLVALGAALALTLVDAPGRCPRWLLIVGYLSPALSMLLETFPGVATAPCLLALVFAGLIWEALASGTVDRGVGAAAQAKPRRETCSGQGRQADPACDAAAP